MPVKTVFALEARLVIIDILFHNNIRYLPFISQLFSTSLLLRQQYLLQVVDTL